MAPTEAWLPRADVVTRHEVLLPVPPERALEVALATPAVRDGILRLLFLLRGVPAGGGRTLGTLFPELELSPREGRRLAARHRDARGRRRRAREARVSPLLRIVAPFSGLVRRRWLAAERRRGESVPDASGV